MNWKPNKENSKNLLKEFKDENYEVRDKYFEE